MPDTRSVDPHARIRASLVREKISLLPVLSHSNLSRAFQEWACTSDNEHALKFSRYEVIALQRKRYDRAMFLRQ